MSTRETPATTTPQRPRRRRRLFISAALAVAIAAHVAFWYLPRERAASLDPRSAAGELFATGPQQVRLWLPYPHQNLAAAARAVDDPAAAVAAASRLSGLGDVEIPAFGPFAMPPADALAIAVDSGGESLEVVVEVFPAVVLLARIAGVIADNPLLRGGVARVSGREMEVAWQGRAWSLRSSGAPVDGVAHADAAERRAAQGGASREPAAEGEDHLALLSLAVRRGRVEPGVYRLHRDGRDLVLASSGAGAWKEVADVAEAHAHEHDLAFLGLRAEPVGSGATVLVMPRTGGAGLELPDAAVAWSGDVERFSLPGEQVMRLLGQDLLEASVGPWDLVALDRSSLEAATRIAPALGERSRAADVTLVLWIRPRDYLPLVSAVAEVLDALPLAPPEDVAYWLDLETLLDALGPVERLTVAVASGGGGARLGWESR